jgi:cytochrome P450
MVVNPRGVSIQVDDDKSSHVPPGASSLCLPSHGVHHDPFYYQSPLEFQPFRYSEPREEFLKQQQQKEARSSNGEDLTRHKTALDLKTASLVTTSEAFLAFGHGRHACPGRFFAAQEMKLMLAYVLQITI